MKEMKRAQQQGYTDEKLLALAHAVDIAVELQREAYRKWKAIDRNENRHESDIALEIFQQMNDQFLEFDAKLEGRRRFLKNQ